MLVDAKTSKTKRDPYGRGSHKDLAETIKRNEIELLVVRWMDLESVIQSEVSQKEKNKYRMLTHTYMESKEKKKVLMDPGTGQE